eukprot:933068-Prorocentrum_minimum.AAC.1
MWGRWRGEEQGNGSGGSGRGGGGVRSMWEEREFPLQGGGACDSSRGGCRGALVGLFSRDCGGRIGRYRARDS